jgi:hypothetical protein
MPASPPSGSKERPAGSTSQRRPKWADLGGKLANDNGDQARHLGSIDDLHVDRLKGRVEEPVVDNELTDAHLGTLQDGIVHGPYPEGDLWVATFRDPAGDVLGIWHAGDR